MSEQSKHPTGGGGADPAPDSWPSILADGPSEPLAAGAVPNAPFTLEVEPLEGPAAHAVALAAGHAPASRDAPAASADGAAPDDSWVLDLRPLEGAAAGAGPRPAAGASTPTVGPAGLAPSTVAPASPALTLEIEPYREPGQEAWQPLARGATAALGAAAMSGATAAAQAGVVPVGPPASPRPAPAATTLELAPLVPGRVAAVPPAREASSAAPARVGTPAAPASVGTSAAPTGVGTSAAPTGATTPAWTIAPEDSRLPRQTAAPASPAAPSKQPSAIAGAPAVYRDNLRFHGKGSEYFRIWVVNLCLTLFTLGIYSAWAKVRKARWFAQHTSLAGDRFDYHGEPWRILVGRVLALVLLGVWTLAFDLSAIAGLLVLVAFCVVGPALFASAQRFRLANTSWRGLRFGYDVPRTDVYWVCVPLLLLWTAGSVLEKLGVSGAWYAFGALATGVGLPWAHARLKQLQHHHAHYGEQQFSFRPAGNEFYALYMKAFFLMVIGSVIAAPIVSMVVSAAGDGPPPVYTMLGMAVAGLFMWLTAWPYFAARMQQIVWSHTELGHGVRFAGRMKGSRLSALVLGQTLLTVITLGLYWPFAAVAIARYRVESVVLESDDPIGDVVGSMNTERRAAGDAALDFFGLDLGW